MRPTVLLDTDRVFVLRWTRAQWAIYGMPTSWWFDWYYDRGQSDPPLRQMRDPSVFVRVCGVDVTVYLGAP